jgi:Na+-translocating ferredoxin:NAD+ oxidoreductase RnfD subunit
MTTAAAACGPLLAGAVIFGWRAVAVAGICVLACVAFEQIYYRVTQTPALLGRSHAVLTGLLLALTLPPYLPWYVPVIAAAFAIFVGKAIFGGEGHFLWQPALVARLAVAVLSAGALLPSEARTFWPELAPAEPVLSRQSLVLGDIRDAAPSPRPEQWSGAQAGRHDAILMVPVAQRLAPLTREAPEAPFHAYDALAWRAPGQPPRAPVAMVHLPPISEMIYGTRPGGIGETCIAVILIAGLYLVYRSYVKWQLPVGFIFAAGLVAAIAPIRLVGPGGAVQSHWLPVALEGLDVGLLYVAYQLTSGAIVLAAFFFATEMTTRPVTTGGQVLFGLGAGALAMMLQLYVATDIPAYLAVLAMNTFAPAIDRLWRPRVLGQSRLGILRSKSRRKG